MNKLNELSRLNHKLIPDQDRYWALYATSFYENLFEKIHDIDKLKFLYKNILRSPKLDGRDRDALTFFYRIRRDELADPHFWDKVQDRFVKENKNQNMKAKLVKESLNEYYDPEPDELSKIKMEARKISGEEGVVQHVNEIRPGVYTISDWYDSEKTIISYENGRIVESVNENFLELLGGGLAGLLIGTFLLQNLITVLMRKDDPKGYYDKHFKGDWMLDSVATKILRKIDELKYNRKFKQILTSLTQNDDIKKIIQNPESYKKKEIARIVDQHLSIDDKEWLTLNGISDIKKQLINKPISKQN